MRLFRRHLLLELAIAVALIGLVVGVLATRLIYYQELAEKTNMEFTLSALQSGLRMQKSVLLMQGRTRDPERLAKQNPMEWLDPKPANYLGQFALPPSSTTAAGNWYFDLRKKVLVYTPKRRRHFRTQHGAHNVELGLAVNPSARPPAAAAPILPSSSSILDVELRANRPYRWF